MGVQNGRFARFGMNRNPLARKNSWMKFKFSILYIAFTDNIVVWLFWVWLILSREHSENVPFLRTYNDGAEILSNRDIHKHTLLAILASDFSTLKQRKQSPTKCRQWRFNWEFLGFSSDALLCSKFAQKGRYHIKPLEVGSLILIESNILFQMDYLVFTEYSLWCR